MFTKSESIYFPLRQDDDESVAVEQQPLVRPHKHNAWKVRFFLLLLASVGTIAPLSVYVMSITKRPSCSSPTPGVKYFYSPAHKQATYVYKQLMRDDTSPKFTGKPRPELDQAWHNLLEGTLMKFSSKELERANATSLAHKDGGYVAGLGVSHNLHCLKRLKQYMHPEYYYTQVDDWEELEEHADHCLEALRLSLMCQADLSIYTLGWTPHSTIRPGVHIPNPNVCVDWEPLHAWMKGRAASLEDAIPLPPEIFKGLPDSH